MYPFLAAIAFIQQFRPYIRKQIADRLDPHEFVFLNTMFIALVVSIYLIYLWATEQHSFTDMITKYSTLTIVEYICIFLLAVFTVSSSIFVFHLDKYYNNPFMNSIFLKSAGMIMLILVSVFVFKEKYTINQIFGIAIILSGIFITSVK
jgi:drug/metabolite transporter (DMT)-like permease